MTQLTAEIVRELLTYNPDTGNLLWKPRAEGWFQNTDRRTAKHACFQWNNRYANKPALAVSKGNGYLCGRLFGKNYLAHRVIWLLQTGDWPAHEIDHVNGNRSDNRLVNLREVTPQQNRRNTALRSDNKTGVPGLYWNAKIGKWCPQITRDGKAMHLGVFDCAYGALKARKAAEQKLNFHPNHCRKGRARYDAREM